MHRVICTSKEYGSERSTHEYMCISISLDDNNIVKIVEVLTFHGIAVKLQACQIKIFSLLNLKLKKMLMRMISLSCVNVRDNHFEARCLYNEKISHYHLHHRHHL